MEKAAAIFIGQNEIQQFKERNELISNTPAVSDMPKIYVTKSDPSAPDFYVMKHTQLPFIVELAKTQGFMSSIVCKVNTTVFFYINIISA